MSKFATKMVAGLSAIYDRLGDPARYTFRNGSHTDCTVIVTHDFDEYGDSTLVGADSVLVRVRCSELTNRPLRDEVFTLTETCQAFTVVKVLPNSDDFEHRVLAK